jgi:hypothetical protein
VTARTKTALCKLAISCFSSQPPPPPHCLPHLVLGNARPDENAPVPAIKSLECARRRGRHENELRRQRGCDLTSAAATAAPAEADPLCQQRGPAACKKEEDQCCVCTLFYFMLISWRAAASFGTSVSECTKFTYMEVLLLMGIFYRIGAEHVENARRGVMGRSRSARHVRRMDMSAWVMRM